MGEQASIGVNRTPLRSAGYAGRWAACLGNLQIEDEVNSNSRMLRRVSC